MFKLAKQFSFGLLFQDVTNANYLWQEKINLNFLTLFRHLFSQRLVKPFNSNYLKNKVLHILIHDLNSGL